MLYGFIELTTKGNVFIFGESSVYSSFVVVFGIKYKAGYIFADYGIHSL